MSSCLPNYTYTPTFTPSGVACLAPGYSEHRSRRTVATSLTPLFFRSKDQGPQTNDIAVELVGTSFKVYVSNVVVETYTAVLGAGGIANLRTKLAASTLIEMTPLHYDIYDTRLNEKDTALPIPAGGLAGFAKVSLIGGTGGPRDSVGLASIRTGPSRSIYITQTIENAVGMDVDPPANQKVKQWNGEAWVSYSNYVQGSCPV